MILSVMPADVVEQVNICGNTHDDLPCLHLFHARICNKKNIYSRKQLRKKYDWNHRRQLKCRIKEHPIFRPKATVLIPNSSRLSPLS
jgi:hypothetical protein